MENGIILIDKKEGMGSREVDNALMRLLATRKIGHLGTLDPFATGLLLIGVNGGTKCLTYIDSSKKEYVATLRLGYSSSTLDPEGVIEKSEEPAPLEIKKVREALEGFLGEGEQIPPMTSAIKVAGVPLYKMAHKGKEIERKPRKINVYSIKLLSISENDITFDCLVSEGTYIRVLGADIAKALGSVGYLTSLRRVKIGDIDVSGAIPLEEASMDKVMDPLPFLSLPKVEIEGDVMLKRAMNGASIRFTEAKEDRLLLTYKGKAIAVYKRLTGASFASERGLF